MKGNCLFWALLQKFKFGGFLFVRSTPNYWFVPRTSWSIDGETWWRFSPLNPIARPTLIQKLLPIHVLWFSGKVIRDHGAERDSSRRICNNSSSQ